MQQDVYKRQELAGRGVTVNCVAPGFIETDMTAVLPESVRAALLGQIPQARLGTAEEVAAAVAFLASPEAAYITGQVLSVAAKACMGSRRSSGGGSMSPSARRSRRCV